MGHFFQTPCTDRGYGYLIMILGKNCVSECHHKNLNMHGTSDVCNKMCEKNERKCNNSADPTE